MNRRVQSLSLTFFVCAALLCGCASAPPASPDAATTLAATPPPAERTPPPLGQTHYKWSKATDAEVAAQLDKKFEEAAKSFVQLKRDDQLMFCKKYKEMGSTIRTLHCITEAELRKQVEDSDELRANMRNKMGRCTGGQPVACGAGQ